MSAKSDSILHFILTEVDAHPEGVVARTAEKYDLSRQAVLKRMNRLINDGELTAAGTTRARRYALARREVLRLELSIIGLEEDVVYRQEVRPAIGEVPENIGRICAFGFTEILNNAIDHSSSARVEIIVSRTPCRIEFTIRDYGVGIFNKIKNSLGLGDERLAPIELAKGRFTTDRDRHSGQGIFFTSRLFDHFSITSGDIVFLHRSRNDDWLIQENATTLAGTSVNMWVCTLADTQTKEVFDRFSTVESEGFFRTQVPLRLAECDEFLISRSQAKRIMSRIDEFTEVLLDFQGIATIGQAFADEIFRVFRRNHPNIRIEWTNANEAVSGMIHRAEIEYRRDAQPPS